MFYSTDIRPGDAVLCTLNTPISPFSSNRDAAAQLKRGRAYRVRELVRLDGEIGLRLKGDERHPDAVFLASRFRKIRAADADFTRSCRAGSGPA